VAHLGRDIAQEVALLSHMVILGALTETTMTTVRDVYMNANKDILVRFVYEVDASVDGQGKLNASVIQIRR
jgi:hypothetical protein